MPAHRIDTFGGMTPAVDEHLLRENMASHAENVFLDRGSLVGQYVGKPVYEMANPGYGKVYRIPLGDANDILNSLWMEFSHRDTDVLRSPVVGDTYERYYWVSPLERPTYNTRERIEAGDPAWMLGVPAPSDAPTVTPSGGTSSVLVSRAYVVTFVSTYGEEGPPSEPTLADGKEDDDWVITIPTPSGTDTGLDRTLEKARIYRTITSSTGQATYFLVNEVDMFTPSYTDDLTDDVVALNSELESTNWSAPPEDLQGMISLPNGFFAAFRENEIWFSEPYHPHAWPAAYSVTVEYPIVGLGAFGQTLVIATKAYPLMGHGVHPSAFSLSRLPNVEPCTSRGSIVSTQEGVYYSAARGLALVSQGQAQNVTRGWMTMAQWGALAPLTSLRAGRLANGYWAAGTDLGTNEPDDAFRGVMITPDDRIAISVVTFDEDAGGIVNVWNDPWSGELLYIQDGIVNWLDQSDTFPYVESYIWRSKKFQTPNKRNLAAVRVTFETLDTTPEQSAERNTDLVQELNIDQYGLLRVYADGELKCTRELRTSGELMRLPSGFKADEWQFEIEARVRVFSLEFATSAKDLIGA